MQISVGDPIIVIDGRSENFCWRGQNQRSFEIGPFPRNIVEDHTGKKFRDISRPLKNSFIHTGHGSHHGKSWGKAEAIDDIYLRSPMQASDLIGGPIEENFIEERKLPGRHSMKMKTNPAAASVVPEVQPSKHGRHEDGSRESTPAGAPAHIRPHRPAPGWNSDRVQAYKSLPDLQKVYQEEQANDIHNREDSLIDLSPAEEDLAARVYANTEPSAIIPAAKSVTSLIDQPLEQAGGTSLYQNNDIQNAHDQFNESDVSFNSLPEGETYHMPPVEDEEDPFDTSRVVIYQPGGEHLDYSQQTRAESSTGRLSKADSIRSQNLAASDTLAPSALQSIGGDVELKLNQSGSQDDYDNKPSIISQLLASSSCTPPPTMAVTPTLQLSSTPDPIRTAEDKRHRRAVSTISEAEAFLPPLTSPFSPPAFNPYDIVLGSNEAIAGLDSPAPQHEKPKRQANHHPSKEPFSWLNDKIGDMKISQNNENNVFQFPSVLTPSDDENTLAAAVNQDLYLTIKKVDKGRSETASASQNVPDVVNREGAEIGKTSRPDGGEIDFTLATSKNIERSDRADISVGTDAGYVPQGNIPRYSVGQPMLLSQQQHQKPLNMALTYQNLQQNRQHFDDREQKLRQEQQAFEHEKILRENAHQQQMEYQRKLQQQALAMQREKEMEKKNLEKLQKQKIDRERKRLEEERQRGLEEERRRWEEQKVAAERREAAGRGPSNSAAADVFHFPQFSTVSTVGQSQETYAVDRNFIRDLEKNLGTNESKFENPVYQFTLHELVKSSEDWI